MRALSTLRRSGRALAACVCAGYASALLAGGNIDEWDVTDLVPSPIPGEIIAEARGYRWDDRCIPNEYRANSTVDPIPNGNGIPPLPLVDAIAAFAKALESWNEIPTSYIEMRLAGTVANPEAPGFDFVNEISFRWPPEVPLFLGYSPATVLIADSALAHGDDLDLDGDADVSSAITLCRDVDRDGDVEFPAGSYAAGTILDNDVLLHPAALWTTDGTVATGGSPYDLQAVTTHELGHSHGLAHSGIVQTSEEDGTAATMFNAYRDAIDKIAMRTLHSDDIAWSSFLYPEGSRKQGAGALQKGDQRFDGKYAVIRGEIADAAGGGAPGTVVFAEDLAGNVVASTIAGRVRASVDLRLFNRFFTPANLLPPDLGIVDAKYALPVPKGFYKLGVEPNDGLPEPTLATIVGGIGYLYGTQFFTEEYFNGIAERGTELRLGAGTPIAALRDVRGVNFVIDRNVEIRPAASMFLSLVGIGPRGILLAVRVPREHVLEVDEGRGILVQAATFGTGPLDTTPVAVHPRALIATGKVAATGEVSIDLAHPLAQQAPFVGQELDLTPLYVDHSLALGLYAQHVLPLGDRDLFVVLDYPADEYSPGISPYGVLGDIPAPGETAGDSYYSADGGATWSAEVSFRYAFGLVVAPR